MIFIGFLLAAFVFPENSYRFIVLGDRAGGPRPGIFPAVVAKTLSLKEKVSFYINVGDLIQGYTSDTSLLKRQWDEVMAELKPITGKFPMHYVPGNHDITDSLQLPMYLRYAGKPYYSFDFGPDHFIVLDNSRGDGFLVDQARQLEWLKKDLEKSKKARYTFCFYHMPRWNIDPGEKVLDTLHAIFKAGGVDAVINGHYHSYQYGVRDNIRYITLGSSGGAADPLNRTTGNAYQFLVADVGKDSAVLKPFLLDGDTMRLEWVDRNKLVLMGGLNNPFWISDPKGNSCALSLLTENPLKAPLLTRLFWEKRGACGWVAAPETLSAQVPSGGKKEFNFRAKTSGPEACLTLHAGYRWPGDSLIMDLTPSLRRQISVARASGKISPDGELSEKTWTSLLNRPEYRFGNNDTASDSTWFGLAYDRENLYLAWLCYEKDIDSMPVVTPADSRDCLSPKEIRLCFYLGYKAIADSFYQVQFNIPGALLDMKVRDAGENWSNDNAWNGVSAWKGKRLKDRWQGESVLPWKALGLKGPEDLRFNCRRNSNRDIAYQEPYERQPRRFAGAVLAK